MENMTDNNTDTGDTVCPITLDKIEPINMFKHAGITFDIFALYTYLTKTVVYVNPVTRTQFTLEDLQNMEEKIKSICGSDAIAYQSVGDREDTISSSTSVNELDIFDPEDYEYDDRNNMSLELRVTSPRSDDRIRLQVDLTVTPPSSESDDNDNQDYAYFDMGSLTDYSNSDLPPSQCYPSIVDMFHDKNRAKKMKADLDLIQYLSYDSLDILHQMISLLSDEHFHQIVWEQTYPTVFDAITRLIRDRNEESSVDVEVTYSDCWETYRTRVLRVLNRRYAEVIQDMKHVDTSEAELCITSHISMVDDNNLIPNDRKVWLLGALRELLRSV